MLVERAKNLVAIAQQVEASYFAALERTDAENYGLLQAGHDLRVARTALDIHDLKVTATDLGIQQAAVQRDRAQLQASTYEEWILGGLNRHERNALSRMRWAAGLQVLAAAAHVVSIGSNSAKGPFGDPAGAAGNAFSALSSALSISANVEQTLAGYQRRLREWTLQQQLAGKDVRLGELQVKLAMNQRQIAVQERVVAGEQVAHAEAVAEFLATKFTNAELHQWMSGVLGRVYAYFLQQATAAGLLAQTQLSFERQEPTGGFIAGDYWEDIAAARLLDPATDRRGLTGSARLLQDLHQLDQHAFQTDRRKLHVTQTLSMSQLAGFELQEFRQTGVLRFVTPEELFDREFPGHHLRLVKRIKVSVIALVPPVRGIRATLSTSGSSRTVVARGPFETVTLRREPESIAFTSPIDATGLFELEPENGMLLPFEGMGVDAGWELELPKAANPFDYNTIVDVLVTMEYTALDSQEYRRKVVRRLDRRFTADRTFSLRNEFPDAWYELNNPDTVEDPERRMRAVLALTAADFPPHIQELLVEELTLFVVRKDPDDTRELTITSLTRTTDDGKVSAAAVQTTGGVVGTRRPGGAAWRALTGVDPVADWEIRLPDTQAVRSQFADGLIEDLVLVLSLAGTTPSGP